MNRVDTGLVAHAVLIGAVVFTAGPVSGQEVGQPYGGVTGRVLEADGRRPVGQVDVVLVGLDRRAVTDARGRFRFDSVPAGEQRLRVRHLGFESRELTVEVPPGQILGVTIRLDPEPVALDPLDVEVESELRIPRLSEEGFYYRRELNFGHFFGPQYMTRWSGTRVADIVGRTPGFVLRSGHSTGREPAVINRRKGCEVGVIVDGIPLNGNWVLAVPSSEVAAVEVYQSAAQTAGSPWPGGRCGLILVWTWRGPNPFHDSASEQITCPKYLKRFRSHAC